MPRRKALASATRAGVAAGQLAPNTDVDAVVSLLIGSFYGVYVARGAVPRDWPARVLSQVWPLGLTNATEPSGRRSAVLPLPGLACP